MVVFYGTLLSSKDDEPVASYAVQFNLTGVLQAPGSGRKAGTVLVPLSTSARTGADGRFRVIVDADGELQGPVEVVVSAPNGVEVERQRLSLDEAQRELNLRVSVIPPFVVAPSGDPTLGQRIRVTGQVIDERGRPVPAGLPVVIWGVDRPNNGAEPPERPLIVGETQANGLFSGDWPTAALVRAVGRISGGPPLPVPLDENGRLVRHILLVINLDDIDAAPRQPDASCACAVAPPRAPDQADLTANPGAFSQDLSGGCVDLTTPNRALEEFSYFLVVRTSEPNVKGVTLGVRRKVPRDLLVDLLGVSIASTALGRFTTAAVSLPTNNLGLDVRTARTLVRQDRPPTLAEIERAAWLSEVTHTKELIDAGLRQASGRVDLDASHPIDWDDTPTVHLAMDLAHGHILRYREVWRADGYSLGDLLYSLPLAPGQRRQVAVVDWDRRTTSVREEQLEFEEEIDALLSRDRDIQEIVGSNLHEETSAGSRNTTWGVAGGIGAGFIGSGFGIFGGVAGGASGSDSEAWQRSSRQFSADSLQRLRDRVAQRSSSVRSQRSSVVQAVTQGETLRAETEVVANYNHCHAITIEYFEVLRHFLVTHELADVQECLFVPLPIAEFNRGKALRWREPLSRYLKDRSLGGAFTAIERIADNWVGWDFPESRYSEEAPQTIEGELRISFLLPRPRDDQDGKYQVDMWRPYAPWLPVDTLELFTARLNERAARERDLVFRQEIAPEIAKNLVQNLHFAYVTADGGETEVPLDATLVSRYHESQPLYVSLNPAGNLPNVPREDIAHFKIWFEGPPLPPDAQVIVHSGRARYRTEHMTAFLFNDGRVLDDIREGDPVVVPTPVSRQELRNPRQEDLDLADRLVEHLNKHLEYYHQAIWLSLDPQRRYMLLDAVLMPGLDGRSVASVCTNELIGIAGNSLVLPVAPGQRLDPTLDAVDEEGNPVRLENAYAASPAPPLRVSVPTRGVYAEVVSGECNVCEAIDDSRYWRWTTAGQLSLPGIQTVSTGSRATGEPDLTPTELPKPLVSIQNAPALPDPFGLSAAFQLLSKPDLFRDITGLEGTQRNARAAFEAALSAASSIGEEAATLARQQELGRNAERMLDRIQQAQKDDLLSPAVAQELANSALQGLIGESQNKSEQPTEDKTVEKVLDQSAQASNADIKVSTPDETVEISFEDDAPVVGAASGVGRLHLKDPDPNAWVDQAVLLEPRASVGDFSTFVLDQYDLLELVRENQNLATAEARGLVRKHPSGEPNRFQLGRELLILYPADAADPAKVGGSGRLPVAVLVHGNTWNMNQLIPSHMGFEYLQEELARQGIVSVSVDTNAANWVNSFIEMRAQMVLGALDTMRGFDGDPKSRFHNRLDFSKVALMGHSRGGDGVVRAAKINAGRTAPQFRYGIQAVCALAPTDMSGITTTGPLPLTLNPADTSFFAVIYGGLDADVSGTEGARSIWGTGFRHYDRAKTKKAMVFVDHCSHNRFNTVWTARGDESAMHPDDKAAGSRLLSPADHKELAKEYIGGLFRWKLLGQNTQRGLFDGSRVNTRGAGVSLQWSFGERIDVIDDMEDPLKPRVLKNSFIDPLADITIGTRSLHEETNHQTAVFYIEPNLPSAGVLALQLDLPDTQRDWTAYDALNFRVSADFDLSSKASIAAGSLPRFEIIITDADGNSAVVDSSSLTTPVAPRRPVFHEILVKWYHSKIVSSSVANPTEITTEKPHKLESGSKVVIIQHSGSTPPINDFHIVTKLTDTTFTIPVDVTVAGSGGFIIPVENCSALRLETLSLPIRSITGIDPTKVASVAISPPASFPSHMFFDSLELIRF